MSQDTLVTGSKLTAIANAIRTRGGTQAQLTLDEMPTAVEAIPGGFDVSVCDGISFYGGSLSGAPDLSTLDTSGFTRMNNMFNTCSALTSLDLSGFDTGMVENMAYMFYNCAALTSLDLSDFDTSNVTDMSYMFNGCSSLTSPDLSGFDTGMVENMMGMFGRCTNLATLDLSGFDTSNVTDMSNMFINCSALTSLDLSDFDTPKVTNMSNMLRNMTALRSVNLSNIDTTNIEAGRLNYFVQGDTLLTEIIWSQKTTVQPLVSTPSAAYITSSMKFYVPDNLVSAYKSATNWSTIASQIYPISQLPASVAALYGIE